MLNEKETVEWLLAGDPAVRWQTRRDLLDADPEEVAAERQLVAEQGWGCRYLELQDEAGTWGGGLYGPKWISTTYTLLNLRRIGLPQDNPQAQRGCQLLLDEGFYHDGGINYFPSRKQSETCVTGMVLSLLSYFRIQDERVAAIAEHLLAQQMADQGWNCRSFLGDTHSSFHTTICALEGLFEFEQTGPPNLQAVRAAQAAGREFLLQHRLYKSHRTGEVVSGAMTRFPFPPGWQHDVLRALDYFQASQAERDPRLEDGIQLLLSKRKKDGRWQQYAPPSGRYFFKVEQAGQPSRWNTLRALRVLRWWEGE